MRTERICDMANIKPEKLVTVFQRVKHDSHDLPISGSRSLNELNCKFSNLTLSKVPRARVLSNTNHPAKLYGDLLSNEAVQVLDSNTNTLPDPAEDSADHTTLVPVFDTISSTCTPSKVLYTPCTNDAPDGRIGYKAIVEWSVPLSRKHHLGTSSIPFNIWYPTDGQKIFPDNKNDMQQALSILNTGSEPRPTPYFWSPYGDTNVNAFTFIHITLDYDLTEKIPEKLIEVLPGFPDTNLP